jgi:hypothetical protein
MVRKMSPATTFWASAWPDVESALIQPRASLTSFTPTGPCGQVGGKRTTTKVWKTLTNANHFLRTISVLFSSSVKRKTNKKREREKQIKNHMYKTRSLPARPHSGSLKEVNM